MSIPLRTALATAAGFGAFGSAGSYYYLKSSHKETLSTPVKEDVPKHHDRHAFQLLSKDEISKRLRSGQFATRPQINHVKAVYTNRLPSNNPVEDNYSINTFQQGLIAGVYDGHIGPECSKLIKKQLPIYMARELSKSPLSEEETEQAISTAFVELDQDIQQRFYNLFPKKLKNTSEEDIKAAIARQPDQKATQAIIDEAINGSCALTVYLKDGIVYSSNTGDSRVVIVSQDEEGNWNGRRLVEEESPARPEWKAHMIAQHPPNESDVIVMRNRIFGLIAVGGSFGDIMYKVPVEYQMKVFPYLPYDTYKRFARYHHRIVVNYRTPPYLESKPLISRHKLQKGDKFIILGTDGLWDELSWDDCRSREGDQVAAEIMSRWKTQGEMNPATHLTRQALLYDAVYKNVKVKEPVENEELELSKRLTRQPSRSFRDDITITVIELDVDQNDTEPILTEVGPIQQVEELDASVPRLFDPSKKQSQSWFFGGSWSKL